MKKLLVIIALLFPCYSYAGHITVPSEVNVKPGRHLVIPVETDCKKLVWLNPWVDVDLVKLDDKRTMFFSLIPGTYSLTIVGADKDEPVIAYCKVVVDGVIPPVPPVPPNPPNPPVPPAPSALTKAIQDAYNSESDPDRISQLKNLTIFYKTAAKQLHDNILMGHYMIKVNEEWVEQASPANTWGELYTAMKQLAQSLGISSKLPLVQSVIQKELMSKLPLKPDAAVDRVLAEKTFTDIGNALDGVK